MAALTVLTVTNRIRSLLGDNPWYDICTEAMDTTEVGLDVADGTKYSVGVIVEFQDDGEQCLVTGIASNTLTVIRNFNYSVGITAGTGTSHSINAVIAANPAFKWVDITRTIDSVCLGLWPYVWRRPGTNAAGILTLTPTTNGTKWYDLAADVLDLSIISQAKSTTAPLTVVKYGISPSYPAELHFGLPTTIAASTVGLYLPHVNNTTNSIIVFPIYRITSATTGSPVGYTHFEDGLEADCIVYLTCARLILQTEVTRLTQDDVSMGDATVQPGSRRILSTFFELKGVEYRNQWHMLCQQQLPRLRRGRAYSVNGGSY